MYNFGLGDCISRLNAARASRLKTVKIHNTKVNQLFLKCLVDTGVIAGVFMRNKDFLIVFFKYNKRICSFKRIKLISKPGKKIYWNLTAISRNIEKSSSSLIIVSTTKGMLLGTDCLWLGQGGEPIAEVYL